jgi:hypothetical protein
MADHFEELQTRKAEWGQYLARVEELGKTVGQSIRYIKFTRFYPLNNEWIPRRYADEFSRLILDNIDEWFGHKREPYWYNYRADQSWIELCMILFNEDFEIANMWVPFSKRPKFCIVRGSCGKPCETFELVDADEYYKPMVCTNFAAVMDFINKFKLIQEHFRSLHKTLKEEWRNSLSEFFKHTLVDSHDRNTIKSGHYYMDGYVGMYGVEEWSRAQPGGYYIDKIKKMICAIKRLPISLMQKCCDIYGNDPYLFDQLIILDGLVMSGAKLDDIVL